MPKVETSLLSSAVALATLLGQLVSAVASSQGAIVLTGALVILQAYFRAQGGAPGPVEDVLTLSPFLLGLSVMRSLDSHACAPKGGIYYLCL